MLIFPAAVAYAVFPDLVSLAAVNIVYAMNVLKFNDRIRLGYY